MGSDKDRPPRSDASWSTSSSLSGVESSADRLDNARMRQSASDAGSETRCVEGWDELVVGVWACYVVFVSAVFIHSVRSLVHLVSCVLLEWIGLRLSV